MSIPKLIRSFEASADVDPYRIVRFSDASASSKIAEATAATQAIFGTTGKLGGATGDMVDVTLSGLGDVQLGGTVTAGAWLTSDADGKAIAATLAGQRLIGQAHAPGVADDVIPYLCAPGIFAVAA
ncbi:capsid cement protein [Sphingomonas sp.]|uniref:capsid cement protein n=1 Tax=Sphingomonas sp. TaxID=28214 RepID=UPI00307F29D8